MSANNDESTIVEHQWHKKHFNKPTYCSFCEGFLWGVGKQGYICIHCKSIAHSKCRQSRHCEVTDTKRSLTNSQDSSLDDSDGAIPCSDSARMSVGSLNRVTGYAHSWYKKHFSSPTYCSHCREFLWGLSKQGFGCSYCDYVAHGKCTDLAPDSCSPTMQGGSTSSATNSPTASPSENDSRRTVLLFDVSVEKKDSSSSCSLQSDNSGIFEHHWVSGNIPIRKKCFICRKKFDWKGFTGERCSKCRCAVHKECLDACQIPELLICTPKHHNLLVLDPETALNVPNNRPLVAFINSRSGGGQGEEVFRRLRRLISVDQVYDLADGGPEEGLKAFLKIPNSIILVCGGDGSACWVLSILDKLLPEDATSRRARYPPISVLPLGTGNDLSRALGWGGGYEGESLSPILENISRSTVIWMDRWKIQTSSDDVSASSASNSASSSDASTSSASNSASSNNASISSASNSASTSSSHNNASTSSSSNTTNNNSNDIIVINDKSTTDTSTIITTDNVSTTTDNDIPDEIESESPKDWVMNNYFSVGVDAHVALNFHQLREEKPHLFTSRAKNKMVYANFGFKAMKSYNRPINQIVEATVDGQAFPIPNDVQGFILLNIPSYGGGTDIWGKKKSEPKFKKPSMHDQQVEIVGVRGTFHMGSIQAGMSSGIRLGQGTDIKLKILEPVAAQCDGEPYLQTNNATIHISFMNRVKMLTNKKVSSSLSSKS